MCFLSTFKIGSFQLDHKLLWENTFFLSSRNFDLSPPVWLLPKGRPPPPVGIVLCRLVDL